MAYKTRTISNSDNIIDSRDVIARIDELEKERDSYEPAETGAGDEQTPLTWAEANEDSAEELATLQALAEEASGSADWLHGEALIRDSYFVTHAQELADDLGMTKNTDWPLNCIDWDEAAELLQQDYMNVDFDGVTYWIRS